MDDVKSLSDWVEQLDTLSLPLLENSCQKLQEIEPYEDVPMARLSNIVLTDPGLTLTLLRHASQLSHKHLQSEILTIDAAAMMLGVNDTAKTIKDMVFLENTVTDESKEAYLQIINRSYHAAYQAYGMARARVDTAPEEVFTAAILRDIGPLMLLLYGDGILNSEIDLNDEAQQKEVLGFTLRRLSQRLAKQWSLSSLIVDSLSPTEDLKDNPRLYEIDLAHRLAKTAESGWQSPKMEKLVEEVAHHLHINPSNAMAEIRDNAINSAKETIDYGVVPAAASLPDLQPEEAESLCLDIRPTIDTQKPDAIATNKIIDSPYEQDDEAIMPNTGPALDMAIINDVMASLESQLEGKLDLGQFMALLKQGFCQGMGMNRSFFAMVTPDRKNLISRFIFGTDIGFRNLRLSIKEGNLFQRLLEKPQPLWSRDDNHNKVIPLIGKEFHKLIDTNDFFINTITIKNKPLGIVYADRYESSHPLDEESYKIFQRLCAYLAKGFGQVGK